MNNYLPALQDAAKAALRYRAQRGFALDRPCDIYDLIGDSDTDLQFEVTNLRIQCGDPQIRPASLQIWQAVLHVRETSLQIALACVPCTQEAG